MSPFNKAKVYNFTSINKDAILIYPLALRQPLQWVKRVNNVALCEMCLNYIQLVSYSSWSMTMWGDRLHYKVNFASNFNLKFIFITYKILFLFKVKLSSFSTLHTFNNKWKQRLLQVELFLVIYERRRNSKLCNLK